MRSSLPRTRVRTILIRLETGRLVVLSIFLGILVGGMCIALRKVLDLLLSISLLLTSYSPPGTSGEGGLLVNFGESFSFGLLLLPLVGGLYAWLIPKEVGTPYSQLVRGFHAKGQWSGKRASLQSLLSTVLTYSSYLMTGRDSAYLMTGQLGAKILERFIKLDSTEMRTLMLAGAAASLGTVLHAPLAAAVLIAEVLYSRFEFEFEVLMPCVLAAVAAYAVYGLSFGFEPLMDVVDIQTPAFAQISGYLIIIISSTAAAWLSARASGFINLQKISPPIRIALGIMFGGATAAIVVLAEPKVLGDGIGWMRLGLSGFLGSESLSAAAWRWLLFTLGAGLTFSSGIFPSVSIGALLGIGLSGFLGLDSATAGLIGAVSFLTVMLNVPLAATLLAMSWAGDAALPLALATAGVSHFLSGEAGIVPEQAHSRSASGVHSGLGPLPDTIRLVSQKRTSEAVPFEQGHREDAGNEPELYRRLVPVSWYGSRLSLLALPPGVEVVGIMREGSVRVPRPETRLIANDEIIFLAKPDAYDALESVLRLSGS